MDDSCTCKAIKEHMDYDWEPTPEESHHPDCPCTNFKELDTWYWTHTEDNTLVLRFKGCSGISLTPETISNILTTFPGDFGNDILAQHGKKRFERVRSVTPSDE